MLMLGKKPVSPGYFPFKPIEKATNCILEIPQNINLEYNNGVVTLKAGSVIALTGDTYSTITTTQDITWSSSTQANTKQYLFITKYGFAGGLYGRSNLNKANSGPNLPVDGSTYLTFFNTTDKIIYQWNSDNSEWESTTLCYPLGIVEIDDQGHITGFAKDSNGEDLIFNGYGFIGNALFIYPNVRGLISDGYNNDGSYKNILFSTSSLTIQNISYTTNCYCFLRNTGTLGFDTTSHFYFQNETPTLDSTKYEYWWCPNDNQWYWHKSNESVWAKYSIVIFLEMSKNTTTYTQFDIRQPLGYWKYFVKMVQ